MLAAAVQTQDQKRPIARIDKRVDGFRKHPGRMSKGPRSQFGSRDREIGDDCGEHSLRDDFILLDASCIIFRRE